LPFLLFFLSLVQQSSFDNENRKLGFAKLVVHAADLLTVDGLFLFKVVEALWEGTYYHGLCMPEKGGGQKGGYLRTVHVS
jgi:hypothetical protein